MAPIDWSDDDSGPSRSTAFMVVALLPAVMVSTFEATMMFNALPHLIVAFHSDTAHVGWVITSYALVAASSAALCGRLGDIYGRRPVLFALLVLAAIGSLIGVGTNSLSGVVTGRAVQGLSGGLLPLCYGIAREHTPGRRVPVTIALIAGAAMLSGAAGNLVAGRVIDFADWHFIFIISAGLAIVAAAFALMLPTSIPRSRVTRVDWLGAGFFAPGIASLLYGVTRSMAWGWLDGRTVAFIAAGLATLSVWSWWELHVEEPMLNLRLFATNKQVLTLTATAIAAVGPIGATGFLLQLIMQTPRSAPIGLGLSATDAGTISFATALVGFVFSPLGGAIARRAGARRSLAVGALFGLLSTALLWSVGNTLGGMVATALVLTITTSFMLSALPILVIESVGRANTSEATGMNTVVQQTFNGVGASVATLLLSLSLQPGTQHSTEHAFRQVYLLVAACCLGTLMLALFMRREPGTQESEITGSSQKLLLEAQTVEAEASELLWTSLGRNREEVGRHRQIRHYRAQGLHDEQSS